MFKLDSKLGKCVRVEDNELYLFIIFTLHLFSYLELRIRIIIIASFSYTTILYGSTQ